MRQRHALTTQCPVCKEKWAIELTVIRLPGGDRAEVGLCDRCNYSPSLGGYLMQSPEGCRFEPLKRRRVAV